VSKVITYLMILSLFVSGCVAPKKTPDMNSFAFILAQSDKMTVCNNGKCEEKFLQVAGSGIVFRKYPDETYVLTAGHVCGAKLGDDVNFMVIDSQGLPHVVREISFSDSPDLCIIKTAGEWGAPVPVGSKPPKYGERVFSMASPRGIFIPGAVLLFDGNYSGRSESGNEIFTMPCAPGSSGSAVINEQGEIVSIVHSASLDFQNIAIGTDIKRIKEFLRAQGIKGLK
jgi:S1-C subfamily serine protease